jgi:hypothetical protein
VSGWHRPDVAVSARDHLAQTVGETSAQQMVDGLIALGRKQRDAEVAKLRERIAELEKQLGATAQHAFVCFADGGGR